MLHEAAHNLVSRRVRLRPTALNLLVTARCNARCVMCNIWSTGKTEARNDLPLSAYRTLVESELVGCVRQVMVSGGEALLRKDIVELTRLLAEGLPEVRRITIATNALATRHVLDRFRQVAELPVWTARRLKLTAQFSFDSLGPAADEIRGPRAHERVPETLDGLLRLREEFPHLSVSAGCVIQPRNLADIPALAEHLRQKKVPSVFTVVCLNDEYYGNSGGEGLQFTPEQKEQVRSLLADLARAERHPGKKLLYRDFAAMLGGQPNRRGCPALRDAMLIEANGNVVPCLNSGDRPIGNLKDSDPMSLWYSPKLRAAAQAVEAEKCSTCMFACGAGHAEVLRDFALGAFLG